MELEKYFQKMKMHSILIIASCIIQSVESK